MLRKKTCKISVLFKRTSKPNIMTTLPLRNYPLEVLWELRINIWWPREKNSEKSSSQRKLTCDLFLSKQYEAFNLIRYLIGMCMLLKYQYNSLIFFKNYLLFVIYLIQLSYLWKQQGWPKYISNIFNAF